MPLRLLTLSFNKAIASILAISNFFLSGMHQDFHFNGSFFRGSFSEVLDVMVIDQFCIDPCEAFIFCISITYLEKYLLSVLQEPAMVVDIHLFFSVIVK